MSFLKKNDKNSYEDEKQSIFMKMDDDVNIYQEEVLERVGMKRDTKVLIGLAIAIVIMVVVTVIFRYDMWNQHISLARLLDSFSKQFTYLCNFLTGKQPMGFVNFNIYGAIIVSVCGAALATCGAVYQGIFHNPMASPTMLGVQSGGTVAISAYLIFGAASSTNTSNSLGIGFDSTEASSYLATLSWYDLYAQQFWTIIGCFVGAGLVVYMSTAAGRGKVSSLVLILCGTIFATFANTFNRLAQYYLVLVEGNDGPRVQALRSVALGNLDSLFTLKLLLVITVPVVVCIIILYKLAPQLNLLVFGDDEAKSMGLNINLYRNIVFAICVIMCGIILAFCGNIGFIGLIVPHLARTLMGSDYKYLLPCSTLLGALVMLVVYFIALEVGLSGSMNLVTSVIGGAFFAFIMIRNRRQRNADWA